MLAPLATLTFATSRRITEVGALLGLIGALVLAGGALPLLRRVGVLLGGLILAAAFVLLIVGIHYGVNPYSRPGPAK